MSKPDEIKDPGLDPKSQPSENQGKSDDKRQKDAKRNKDKRHRTNDDDKGNHKGDKIYPEFRPDKKGVSAVSVMESKGLTNTDGTAVATLPIAVLTTRVWFDAFFDRCMENNANDVRTVVKKRASLYYAILSPTTINDIVDKVGIVVENSLQIFAYICSAWRAQNSAELEDEDGFNLSRVLHGLAFLRQTAGFKVIDDTKRWGMWSVSNALWKREVLSKLSKIYLTDNAKEFIYTLFGNFISFDYADESMIRLWKMMPQNIDVNETFDQFVGKINSLADQIDAAYNTYPFMEEIVADLGLTEVGEKYDFTRDLAAMKLNVLADREHALENMCYMVCTEPVTGALEPDIFTRIVSPRISSAQLDYYADKTPAAKGLNYINRIFVDVMSYANALRGACCDECITFVEKDLASGGKVTYATGPKAVYVPTNIPTSAENMDAVIQVNNHNMYQTLLDMPNDVFVQAIPEGRNIETRDDLVVAAGRRLRPEGGDYIIGENDIESVISDAVRLFCIDPIQTQPISQTLGNSGHNN